MVVPAELFATPAAARRQEEDPMALRFGLQIGRSRGPADRPRRRAAWRRSPARAEEVGFSSISVMDHFVQIPSVGREWEDMLESTATLGYLAAATTTARLGALVTRHHVPQPRPRGQDRGHAGRAVRRAGVLRARHGVVSSASTSCTAGTSRRSPSATSCWRTPSELLPLMWGKGTPPLRRAHASRVPAATCYPARCRTACRSSSADRASGAPCASSPATPTPATCSATRRPSPARSPCCASTAPREARDPAT